MNALMRIFVGLGMIIGLTAAYADSDCAKATVVGGDACGNLEVNFDLSKCGDDAAGASPVVRCDGAGSSATLKTTNGVYRATIKEGPEAWGAKTWVVAHVSGATKKAKPTPVAAVKTKSKRTRRNIARADYAESTPRRKETPPPAPAVTGNAPEAQKAAEPPVSPAATSSSTGIQLSAIFDAYYAYNFNTPNPIILPNGAGPGTSGVPANQNLYRNFDAYHNQLALNLFQLSAKKTSGEVGFRVDLGFGDMADVIDRFTDGTIDEVTKHVLQAIVTYNPTWAPNLTVSVGKMMTHLGYELTPAKDNWNYSRSFQYSLGIPVWHTGANIAYAVIPSKVVAGIYAYNGWNTIYETNSEKTFGWQLNWTPTESFNLVYNGITGPEQPNNNTNRKTVHEILATFTASPKFAVAADITIGKEANATLPSGVDDANWTGVAAYLKLAPTPKYYLSPRFEIYKDNSGATSGVVQQLTGFTVTNSLQVADGLELRVEGRWDHSDNLNAFSKNGSPTNDQVTGSIAVLYSM